MTGTGPPRDGAPATLAWLGHPVTLFGLIALVVNDHLLKTAFPGPLIGKLSDVAGLLLAPPLVAVLLTLAVPRLPARAAVVVGLGAVGAGFTAVKASGYAAQLASAAWSVLAGPSLVREDPTDLLALPALALAWWAWSRARSRPVRHRVARLVRLLVVLPAATFAVAATSAPTEPGSAVTADRVAVTGDGTVLAGVAVGVANPQVRWHVRVDVGRWSDAPPELVGELHRHEPARSACVPRTPARCYRLVSGRLAVERSDDGGGSWTVDWQVSERDRKLLARYDAEPADQRVVRAGRDLALWTEEGDRHGVIVANGRDGFAVRDPGGHWQRIGWPDERARPLGVDPDQPQNRRTAVALLVALGALTLIVAGAAAGRRAGLGAAWPWALLVPTVSISLTMVPELTGGAAELPLSLFRMLLQPVLGVAVLVALASLWAQRPPVRWTFEVLAALAATLALTGVPLYLWLSRSPDVPRAPAMLAALAGALPGLLLAWYAARLVRRVPAAVTEEVRPSGAGR